MYEALSSGLADWLCLRRTLIVITSPGCKIKTRSRPNVSGANIWAISPAPRRWSSTAKPASLVLVNRKSSYRHKPPKSWPTWRSATSSRSAPCCRLPGVCCFRAIPANPTWFSARPSPAAPLTCRAWKISSVSSSTPCRCASTSSPISRFPIGCAACTTCRPACASLNIPRWSTFKAGRGCPARSRSLRACWSSRISRWMPPCTPPPENCKFKSLQSFEQTNYPLTIISGSGERLLLKAVYDRARFTDAFDRAPAPSPEHYFRERRCGRASDRRQLAHPDRRRTPANS